MGTDRLDTLFRTQRAFQERLAKRDGHEYPPGDMTRWKSAIIEMAWALVGEVHEAMEHANWKSWTTPPPDMPWKGKTVSDRMDNRARYVAEMGDALAFFLNLCLLADIQPDELFHEYMHKTIVKNHKRQDDGYNATNKCRRCYNALDDVGVSCAADGSWCMVYGDGIEQPYPGL